MHKYTLRYRDNNGYKPAQGNVFVEFRGIRCLRNKVLDDVLQVALKVHALPGTSVAVHVGHAPAIFTTPLPKRLIVN